MSLGVDLSTTAKSLSRNPLGVIALFLVLVYALAVTFTGFASLQPSERLILVCFIAGFPILVLTAFCWLVACHPHSLYAPADFRREEHFVELQKRRSLEDRVQAQVEIVKATKSALPDASSQEELLAVQYVTRWNNPEMRILRDTLDYSLDHLEEILSTDHRRKALIEIGNFYEELSVVVERRLVDGRIIKEVFVSYVTSLWRDLGSWVLNQRKEKKDPKLWCGFERLAERWIVESEADDGQGASAV